ncbi:disease resistance protein Roq1-like isoform X1 [Trifolium pratense]|uniref:disease resistance protein Roq1-like isoform X1 n=2 Tax=Trifolium pratense TaxID=57577 RepID=UPI001E6972C4|nr:disease resistance protein Roq1-like isoform X1 [Trifolium pratense]
MSSFTSCFYRRRKFQPISTTTNMKKYDVYLSFCDEDPDFFILGIYKGLTSGSGINVFWDNKRIKRGDQEVPTSVLNVIGDCKLVVIVFSTNYFNSRWCLQELEKITECCRTTDSRLMLLTFSFFYNGVHLVLGYPDTDFFEREAFHDFLDRIYKKEISQQGDKFMSWVAAISHNKAITYAGSTYLGHVFTNRIEREHIENVVELATRVITEKRDMFNVFYTESLNSRVQDVTQLLKQSKSPLILGIWGMPGIGKSTIAKAIYGQVGSYFRHKCLIENVKRSVQNKTYTLVSLQEKIILDMAREPENDISTIESGKVILKERLHSKRVLLVLDDVDNLEQLHALCGSREWFGEGSKIIITTTNRQLLKEHGADHIYRVKELDENESLELFNWKAFSQATSQEGFAELSRQVVAYSGGLPLALTDLGIHFNSETVDIWECKLHNFTRHFYNGVQGTLESSFNDLNDEEKQVFFDIAYFYIGIDQHDVVQSLNSSTHCTNLLISLLEDKSFVTIDENNKIQMHVLLQATAEAIITRESSNKTDQPKMYDVFLSFRGEDSRAKFMSHLHSSLQNAGIDTFRDDDEIQRGDQISISLLKTIGQSRISIVVLSKNYANSRWCMLELEKIMKIGRDRGLVVVPVFYEVDPSDVRHQKGQFGKGFDDLTSKISVHESTKTRWQRDLYEICGIAGFVLIDSRNESADIKNIVEHVTRLLDRTQLFVAEHPVGVESRVEAVTKLLNIQKAEDVLLIGIWGMGGTGKTTIAKSIYNKVGRKFEGRSFLLGIREFWETHTNQVSLQQQVLCDVYKTTALKIRDIESGKNILKEKLSKNRVLFVLDDVDELDQLKALCGNREWFGPGSRIIITTRDMDLLRSCGVDQVYTIEEMDESESLELFSWHAFKQPSPTEDYATHSADVIAYSGKLPLALEVLGSYLSNCEITEWQKVLEKLKCIPHDQVQKKLKVSFDGLKDFTEKQIFLDISCFFIGMDKKDVTAILNGCGFFADIGIKVLVERALLTVDNRNKLRMHDLLRDMGRQIIYEESPSDPEKRSRLWRCDEVQDILSRDKGTEAVKGLALEFPRKDCLETKAFKKMNKLRLLRLAGVKLEGDFKYLSGDLRWLYWHGFPETYTPAEFQQGSLVAIELKYSKLNKIWNTSQMLENLKNLNLSHSLDLAETPNFSYLPNLEKLVLKDCPSLSTVSHSIGSLHKLLMLNLTDCTGLQTLPRSIYKLKSLETLILSGCSKIDKLEEDLEQMESLITLIADKTGITKVPFSIVRLKSIGYISLSGFEGFSRDVFPSLIRSWMSPSNNVISLVQTSVSMSSLGTSKDLQKLRIICAKCDSELQLTRDIARFLEVLKATNCQNLEASASSTASEISDMHASPVSDCIGHFRNLGSKNHLKSLLIQMGTKCQISNVAEDSVLQTADGTWDLFLLGCDNKSDWLTFSCKGCSIIFDVPTMKGSYLKSMMLYIVYYSCSENITSEGFQGMLIINYTKTTIHAYKTDTLTSFDDEDWQSITSNLEPGNKVGVMVVFGEGFIVEKTIVSLLYDEPLDKEMERSHLIDEEDLVSGNDNKNVSVSCGDNEAINRFAEEMVNHMQITMYGGGIYADAVGPLQLVPHDPDQPAEAVAEEIPAAEAYGDQEQQVPPPEGQPEQQATAAPEAIGSALGAQILDAFRELRADFFQLEQTVTARLNAVEVRLVVLEDAIAEIPRGSNSEFTAVES